MQANGIAIIGAGPAGCVAALWLARRGWDVSLIEQQRFPRDKVCGECLSALGIETLERLRLLASLRALKPIELRRACLVARDGTEAAFDLPRPMWGLTRAALDAALLNAARDAGVKLVQPARCENVDYEPLSVTIRHLQTNMIETIWPSYVLVADGKGALGASAPPPPTGDLGVKAHFRGVMDAGGTISLFGVEHHYLGVAPVQGNRWNVAMSVPAARVRTFGGNFDALFEQMKQENAGLANRFRLASRDNGWLASPLPRFAVASHWPKHIIPVGNAAAALDPIGGEGMGLAMRSAELAAEAVDGALRSGARCDAAALRRAFDRLWRLRRTASRAAALVASSPTVLRFAIALLRRNDELAAPALATLGK